jgi:hypothetical protein
MEITILGYLLIPIGIFLLFFKKDYLLFLVVFFSGFTGSSVINFSSITFSLQPSYYFGILYLLKHLIDIFFNTKSIVKPNKILFVFLWFCLLSLIAPLFIKEVVVLTPDNKYESVDLKLQNITQFAYLLYCFIIYWMVKDYLKSDFTKIKQITKVFMSSAIIITILGIYQEIAFVNNLPFDEIFRSSLHANIQPYENFIRVSSVAGEPSMYALFLVPIFALTLLIDKHTFYFKNVLLILLIISGILSTSTSFLFGITFFIIIFLVDKLMKFNYKKTDLRIIKNFMFLSLVFGGITYIAFTVNEKIKLLLTDDVIKKITGENVSGMERTQTMLYHLSISLEYPFLGVGFGSARSKELFSTLLVNIGYFGTLVLVIYIIYICSKLLQIQHGEMKLLARGYLYYILTLFFILFVSVPEMYFLYIWIMLGVSESLIIANKGIVSKSFDQNHKIVYC